MVAQESEIWIGPGLSPKEALMILNADKPRISMDTLYRHIRDGLIRARRAPLSVPGKFGRWQIDRAHVLELLKQDP